MRVQLGIEGFLKAGSALRDWTFVVAGAGPETRTLRSLAGGDPRITFVGSLDQARLHEIMLRARVLVSLPRSDGTSSGLMEALAAGMHPLVNDLPSNREWVTPDIGVVVSRNPTASEVADGLLSLSGRTFAGDPRTKVRGAVWEAQGEQLLDRIGAMLEGKQPHLTSTLTT